MIRPRGLCWRCFYTPDIRDLYGPVSKYGARGVSNGHINAPLPDEPTSAAPGTEEKVAVMERRAELGQQLFHPQDAKYCTRWAARTSFADHREGGYRRRPYKYKEDDEADDESD